MELDASVYEKDAPEEYLQEHFPIVIPNLVRINWTNYKVRSNRSASPLYYLTI